MKNKIKNIDTRQPALTRAVLRKLGSRDYLEDIVNHGASGGFPGFAYYSDTVEFFNDHRALILARARDDSAEYGQGMLEMIAGFNCLKNDKLTADQVAAAIYEDTDDSTTVRNALAWYALEEVARELCPNL